VLDRSWYNRAGVEHVMGFCSKRDHERFLHLAPGVEREIVNNGITLLKYFLDLARTSSGAVSRPASATRSSTGS
jgi:polyphosphate kinase 2 (PPK2 family)